MGSRQEILLTGAGGQGLILASIILAEAAVKDNKNVLQTQSYGPEARGGASMSGVIIDVDTIEYPKVTEPTVLLCMNQSSYDKYISHVKPECIVIVDSTFVTPAGAKGYKLYAMPITRQAKDVLKLEVVANMLALGAINATAKLVDREIFRDTIFKLAPGGKGEINRDAFDLGYGLYEDIKDKDPGASA